MAAESILLEGARRALGRGAVDAAIADLDKHARTYPEGYLTEEREVLSVRALSLAGRRESAERRAAAFRKTFPRSIQLEALARALDAKP
jgi:RNA polymerase sigma-70 factor (ECF subfamily)